MHIAPLTPKNWASSLRDKLVSAAVADPLFQGGLEEAAAEIASIAKSAANEATVESAFDSILYATLKEIGVSFLPTKEQPLNTRRHVSSKGRTDTRLGALVIEYKHKSKLATPSHIQEATSQLEDYIRSISTEIPNEVAGFVTDGISLYEVRSTSGEIITHSGRRPLDSEALTRITRCIVSLEKSALTADNLVRDFCGGEFRGVIFESARILGQIISGNATAKTEMLFSEWKELFRLAQGDQSQQRRIQERRNILSQIFDRPIQSAETEYRSLFALHTSYAILLKLIAYRVISDIRFGDVLMNYKSLLQGDGAVIRTFCGSLENGDLFRQLNILNLLEGDFFAWYADDNQWGEELAGAIRRILEILVNYEDVKAIFESCKAVDLFRTLYEATVPQVIRASFGEFYTPHWLAEHVLETSKPNESWTVLDPCCGSGTFIITAIGRMREELAGRSHEEILNALVNRVAAIDLNPLAVLTTRVHFFVHIADLLPKHLTEELVIPVFLGDASHVPSIGTEEGIDFIIYELKTLKNPIAVQLPLELTKKTGRFLNAMLRYEDCIKEKNQEKATNCLLAEIPALADKPVVAKHVNDLSRQLVELEERGWNGIWARIIANFFVTAALPCYTNVVGNPPWIDWKNLPEGYREKVKALCVDKGLFSGAGRTGGINLNICALISHVCAANWLQKGGRLAFLMPRELANQASYEGWRDAVGGPSCKLMEFHDWSFSGHPFDPVKEDFMTFVVSHSEEAGHILPLYTYARRDKNGGPCNKWYSLKEAKGRLEETRRIAARVIKGSTAHTFCADLE
jgi:hypothetical protein